MLYKQHLDYSINKLSPSVPFLKTQQKRTKKHKKLNDSGGAGECGLGSGDGRDGGDGAGGTDDVAPPLAGGEGGGTLGAAGGVPSRVALAEALHPHSHPSHRRRRQARRRNLNAAVLSNV